jgi:hypothetical protein
MPKSITHRSFKPNGFLRLLSSQQYNNGNDFSAAYLLELAVYDPLGGADARQTALDTYINDRIQTKRWFEARASGQTAIQIIQAAIQDQHDSCIIAAACRAFPKGDCDS